MDAALINLSCLSDELVMKGKLLSSEPMAAHTSWRVGGPADNYYVPVDLEDLSMFLAELCEDQQIFWLGNESAGYKSRCWIDMRESSSI